MPYLVNGLFSFFLLQLGQVVERRSGGILSFFRSLFSLFYTLYGMDGLCYM